MIRKRLLLSLHLLAAAKVLIFPSTVIGGKERSWLGPTSFIAGAPSSRQALGLAFVSGRLYVHGGQGTSGL